MGRAKDDLAELVTFCEGSEEQGTGGLEDFVPENVELLRADTILVVDPGNFAVGVPTLTSTLRGMTSVDITLEALGSAMHSGCSAARRPIRSSR
jgi:acetylornithine deacetylase/succinyl-diaminopimelate desuccinylase-like protein